MRILKFPLNTQGLTAITISRGSRFMSIENQNNNPVLYMLCPDNQHKKVVNFTAFETGQEVIDPALTYFGSVMLNNGSLVLHYFLDDN
jgi:hypothetical protein